MPCIRVGLCCSVGGVGGVGAGGLSKILRFHLCKG